MPDFKTIHGFYRHQVLPNREDGFAVKAILAHDAIVHPDHPLRIAGKPGSSLPSNGEARLLFSSAQVEYIRYWLHTMGLTKELIPLPYSTTGTELRNALKMIDKNNRKLKGTDSNLNSRRLMFERVRSLWNEQRGVWCAVDFEAWDMDHTVITEFGWSTLRWINGEPFEDMGHLIVGKHRGYTNHLSQKTKGLYYHFGQSEDVTMKQLKERIHTMIQSMATPGPLFLVFHDNSQDLKYLRSPEIAAPLDELSFFLPESCTEAETSDTPKIYGDSGGQKRSLERVCRLLQIKSTQHLHNAGNDARELAGGDPLDTQRISRWPQHTSTNTGLRVKFSKEDEDSDALPSDDDDDDLITAGPYDPKQRLDGANDEEINDTGKADGSLAGQ
ncbi:hypothetical protein BJV77DRAFT_975193 [Russula vinacea]|nr:hypothetical protein BJV77DRAFT_975193 [Russula vinacea]